MASCEIPTRRAGETPESRRNPEATVPPAGRSQEGAVELRMLDATAQSRRIRGAVSCVSGFRRNSAFHPMVRPCTRGLRRGSGARDSHAEFAEDAESRAQRHPRGIRAIRVRSSHPSGRIGSAALREISGAEGEGGEEKPLWPMEEAGGKRRGCGRLGDGGLMGPEEEAGGERPDTRRPVKSLRRRWGAREREGSAGVRGGKARDSKRTTARGKGRGKARDSKRTTARGKGSRGAYARPSAARMASTLSSRSHGNGLSVRPKWP